MVSALWTYLTSRSIGELFRDVLDILVTYYIFYRALLVLRGTRAMQVGVGLGVVFTLYLVAKLLQLYTVIDIMGALLFNALLIIVVVFQNDIRRGLMRVGSGAWLGATRSQESRLIDEVVEAATELARHRTGAIITFEQDANLDEFVGVNKGIAIDAAVTSELLVSLFVPEAMNKLHDGAVIIRDLRVAKAGVFFPMPDSRVMDASFGSRHRAALGITEETDAVVVVVSEERGTISFCFNGNIVTNLDGPRLRAALDGVFSPKTTKAVKKRTKKSANRKSSGAITPVPASVSANSDNLDRPSVHIITAPLEPDAPTTNPAVSPLRKRVDTERQRSPEKADSQPPSPLRKSRTSIHEDPPSSARPARVTSTGSQLMRAPAIPMAEPKRKGNAPWPRASEPAPRSITGTEVGLPLPDTDKEGEP